MAEEAPTSQDTLLPRELEFHVLTALYVAGGEGTYGYRLVQSLEKVLGVKPRLETIYSVLRSLRSRGLLNEYYAKSYAGPQRRMSALNAQGVLERESLRLKMNAVRQRIGKSVDARPDSERTTDVG